jgi:thiol-disulfide isomerase/thioredoxin
MFPNRLNDTFFCSCIGFIVVSWVANLAGQEVMSEEGGVLEAGGAPQGFTPAHATDFQKGLQKSQLDSKPLVIFFGAEWCVWCKKLDKSLEGDVEQSISDKWTIAKIDVDTDEATAQRLDVQALPSIVVVDTAGDMVASREGFAPAQEIQAWLELQLPKVINSLDPILSVDTKPTEQAIAKWVAYLGNKRTAIRQAAIQRLVFHRVQTREATIQSLRTGSLAQRLSVVEILNRWKVPLGEMDPWNPASLTTEMIDRIDEQLKQAGKPADEKRGTQTSEPVEPQTDAERDGNAQPAMPDSETQAMLLKRWSSVREKELEGLLSQSLAEPDRNRLIQGLRSIRSGLPSLPQDTQSLIRYGILSLVASDRIRIEQNGLLRSLSSNDETTHRQAGLALIQRIDDEDSALLEMLIVDEDAIVRESTIGSIATVSKRNSLEWLERLLADPDKNVRAMTLKVLAPALKSDAEEAVSKYLVTEIDEDLMIYALKFFQSLSEGAPIEPLQAIANHPQWRVRAEVTETIGKRLRDGSNSYNARRAITEMQKQELETLVIERLDDPDTFVRAKSLEYLTDVVNSRTLPSLSHRLTQNMELLEQVLGWKDSGSPRSRSHSYKDSDKQATDYLLSLKSTDPNTVLIASLLLAEMRPDRAAKEMVAQIDRLESQQLKRILAIQMIKAVNRYRDESTSSFFIGNMTVKKVNKTEAPQVNKPESGNDPPAIDPQQEPKTKADNLDSLDDFFGSNSIQGESPTSVINEEAFANFDEIFGSSVTSKPDPSDGKELRSNKATSTREWLALWKAGEAESLPAWHVKWKLSVIKFLNSNDPTEHRLGLLLGPVVGLDVRRQDWLSLMEDPKERSIAMQTVAWLPAEWVDEWKGDWIVKGYFEEPNDCEIFLREFSSTVDPLRAIWLLDHQAAVTNGDLRLQTSLHKACLRCVAGSIVNDFSSQSESSSLTVNRKKATEGIVQLLDYLEQTVQSAQGPGEQQPEEQQRVLAMALMCTFQKARAQEIAKQLIESEAASLSQKKLGAELLLRSSDKESTTSIELLLKHTTIELNQMALESMWGEKGHQQSLLTLFDSQFRYFEAEVLFRKLVKLRRLGELSEPLLGVMEKSDGWIRDYAALTLFVVEKQQAKISLFEETQFKSGGSEGLLKLLCVASASQRTDAASWLLDQCNKLDKEAKKSVSSYHWDKVLAGKKATEFQALQTWAQQARN